MAEEGRCEVKNMTRPPDSEIFDYFGTARAPSKAGYTYLRARLLQKGRHRNARTRAAKYGVENSLTFDEWLAILNASDGLCHYCRRDVGCENLGPDHVYPLSKGGFNTAQNVVACCFPCNCKKHAKITERG